MNGLAQITIDGQPVVLKFGLPALRRIVGKYSEVEMLVGDDYSELGVAHILFAGYLNGCAMKDLVPNIPFDKFYELIERIDEEAVKQEVISAIQAFEGSKVIKDSLGKKKATEMTSPSTGME